MITSRGIEANLEKIVVIMDHPEYTVLGWQTRHHEPVSSQLDRKIFTLPLDSHR